MKSQLRVGKKSEPTTQKEERKWYTTLYCYTPGMSSVHGLQRPEALGYAYGSFTPYAGMTQNKKTNALYVKMIKTIN